MHILFCIRQMQTYDACQNVHINRGKEENKVSLSCHMLMI